MIDRRQFVAAASGSLVAAFVGSSLRHAAFAKAPAAAPASGDVTVRLDALFDVFMDERFAKNPELVSVLGLDKGKYAWAKSQLTEDSLARVHELKQQNASQLQRLKAFGRASLGGGDRANYDTVEFQMETIARTEPFDYGNLGRPYVVSQLTGAYQSVPTFLDRQHQIANKDDADAYLARLRAFAVVLDQETERVHHDAGLKVVPPDFLIDRTLEQMHTLRSASPADSILSTSVGRRTQKLGIAGDYGADAARIVETEVYPALDRQAKALTDLRTGAVHEAGVGRLPEGSVFYEVALRQATTTDMSAEEVHQLGLEQAKDLTARMDALLRAQGRARDGFRARAGARQGPAVPVSEHGCGAAADPRLLQRSHQGAATPPAAVLPHPAEGAGRDPPRACLHRGRCSRGLLPDPRARWLAPRRLLHQPARHQRVVTLEAADAGLSRVRAGPPLPAGAGAGDSIAAPDPQGGRGFLRQHRGLGIVRRAAGR